MNDKAPFIRVIRPVLWNDIEQEINDVIHEVVSSECSLRDIEVIRDHEYDHYMTVLIFDQEINYDRIVGRSLHE